MSKFIDYSESPRWTKSRVHEVDAMYDQLKSHVLDRFMWWWEDNVANCEHTEEATTKFFQPLGDDLESFHFVYQYDTKTWIITYDHKQYEFDEEWLLETDPNRPEPDLKCLWVTDRYDGPLSGVGMLNKQTPVWFTCCDESGLRWYKIYKLSTTEFAQLNHNHNYFLECRNAEKLDEYYDWRKKNPMKTDYADHELLMRVSYVQIDWSAYYNRD